MVRIRTLRAKVRRDLRRRRAQFAAVTVTLFLGVGLFVTSHDAFLNLKASYDELYARTRFADLTVTGGDLRSIETAATAHGAIVARRTVADVPFQIGSTTLLGRIVGVPVGSQPVVDGLLMLQGRYPEPPARDAALVEQHAASHFELGNGDAVRVLAPDGWRTLTVAGVVASPEYLWPARSRQDVLTTPDDFAVLFVPEPSAREIGGSSGQDQVAVYVPDRARATSLSQRLADLARNSGATNVVLRADQPSDAALQEDVQGFDELSLLFPILFLTGAAMAAWILLTRIVQSQRSQIGTLRALGASRRTLLGHYMAFGLAPGLIGGLSGAVAGLVGAHAATGAYTRAISVPITQTPLRWSTALIGVAFGTVVGALAAAGPALAASRVPPAEAMRGIIPSRGGGPSLFERLLPPLRRIPAAARMALRGITRNRRRTIYTISGIVLALVLVLVSWGMIDSTQILLARQFDQVQRQDAQVYLSRSAPSDVASMLATLPGVAATEPAAQVPATISVGSRSYATSLLALSPTTTMHGFLSADDGSTGLPSDGLLLGEALRSMLKIDVGDRVTVVLPSLGSSIEQRVKGFVSEPLGTFAYVSLPTLERALRATGADQRTLANTVLVRFRPGADAGTMRTRISGQPGIAAYVDSRALQRAANGFMALFYAFVGLMLVFGAVLAFALVFNTMSVNVAERSSEIATLRSEGVSVGRIGRLIGTENLLVTAIGVVPGLVFGYLIAKGFMASFSSDLFEFDLNVRPTTFVLASVAVMAVGAVSQVPALRAIRRLDVASALRERTG